jgi:hypothetical protein
MEQDVLELVREGFAAASRGEVAEMVVYPSAEEALAAAGES